MMLKLNKILLFINLFLLQSYLIRFKIGPYPTNLQEILIAAQILIFLYAIIQTKSFIQTVKNIKKHWIILSMILLTGVSAAFVPIENKLDFFRHLKFLSFAAILVFISLETFKTTSEKKQALTVAGLGAITFGLFSVIYNLLGYNIAPDGRLIGPLDAAVYLAYYLTPFFIFFIIEIFENPQKKLNILYALILGFLILATQSMGAIGGSLIIILIYLFKNSKLKILQKRITKIVLVVFCLTIAAGIFYSKILPTIKTNYSSLDERGEIWQTSIKLLKNPKNLLFGVGFGQFQQKYATNVDQAIGKKPLDYHVLQPHNIFLLFIFQYGILGLLFILICIRANIKILIKEQEADYDNNQPNEIRLVANKTSNFILLYFFIHGMIDTPFFKNDMMILLILFMELSLLKATHQPHQN